MLPFLLSLSLIQYIGGGGTGGLADLAVGGPFPIADMLHRAAMEDRPYSDGLAAAAAAAAAAFMVPQL